jgi:hypothetical protein
MQVVHYRSVFLATTILIAEKSSTSCSIARHLDEKSRDCKQRIETPDLGNIFLFFGSKIQK